MRGFWILPLAATIGAYLFLTQGRGYPWQLALLAATAVGALIYASRRTLHNLRLLSRADRAPTVTWIADEEKEESEERER